MESKVESAVGMSRKWDAREAGREVAESAIRQLYEPPSFFLLFSTIHYEKYGGFQEFLNGVWDVLPKGTPLVGGTVAGFMNNYGCYTRGATALAISHPSIDVSIGIGHNTKRNPKKAARQCVEMIKKQSKKVDFYLEFISGPVIPTFPMIGKQTVIKSKIFGSLMKKMIPMLWESNMGTDRADEVLEYLASHLDKPLIGSVCYDDGKLFKNYQFVDEKILKNATILLGISGDIIPEFHTITPLTTRDRKINISVAKDRRTVTKINGKKATQELCKILNWNQNNIKEVEKFYSQAFYYPFCYHKNDKIHAAMLGLILGETVYFANRIESDELELFGLTGKKIISDCKDVFAKHNRLMFGVMCETYIETLGNQIYTIKDMIDDSTKDYLILFSGGESIIYDDMVPHHLYESINTLNF
jgi:hypothetical protein